MQDACKYGHPMSGENLRLIVARDRRKEKRVCIACETARREKYLKKKAKLLEE